jgi:hypothetical protein
MSRKRRASRPADPAEIARRRAVGRANHHEAANWGLDREALTRAVNVDVETTSDAGGRLVRARRQDVFDLLRARGRLSPAALDAVRRLQDDIACLHHTRLGGASYEPRVDRSRLPQSFNDSRLRAGARIEAALARVGAVCARLLAALCEPDVVLGRAADWRAVVERETGETLADAQAAILRMACENLAGAYGTIDRTRSQ